MSILSSKKEPKKGLSFSLAQRKELKETSTLTKPSPIWEGLTAPPVALTLRYPKTIKGLG
jgi:hypothetical protein